LTLQVANGLTKKTVHRVAMDLVQHVMRAKGRRVISDGRFHIGLISSNSMDWLCSV